jgi:hypothetical protein
MFLEWHSIIGLHQLSTKTQRGTTMSDTHPLPHREGVRPSTTAELPHSQTDQQPGDDRFLSAVITEAATWPGVAIGASGVSVEGARALLLTDAAPAGAPEAFMIGREFAHAHAQGDHSLHLTLPLELADEAEAAGWTERHFLALTGQIPRTNVMIYAPRDEDEVTVVQELVRASYDFARGAGPSTGRPGGGLTGA